jgi:hypothetical protein
MRSDWEHVGVIDQGPIGVAGHSFGALLGARFAATFEAAAFAGLSGVWQDWPSGPIPHPLTELRTASLLVWGGALDFFTAVPESVWTAMPPPKHRAVWEQGEHWDYLIGPSQPPCSSGPGPCHALGVATADLVALFFGKYLPPDLATDLIVSIPNSLAPPVLSLTPEQQFFAGGHLSGFAMVDGRAECAVEQRADSWPLVANRRSKETHSRIAPCAWVRQIAPPNRWFVHRRPDGYRWCDFCFPELADG